MASQVRHSRARAAARRCAWSSWSIPQPLLDCNSPSIAQLPHAGVKAALATNTVAHFQPARGQSGHTKGVSHVEGGGALGDEKDAQGRTISPRPAMVAAIAGHQQSADVIEFPRQSIQAKTRQWDSISREAAQVVRQSRELLRRFLHVGSFHGSNHGRGTCKIHAGGVPESFGENIV